MIEAADRSRVRFGEAPLFELSAGMVDR
jgi:hypothetical protein